MQTIITFAQRLLQQGDSPDYVNSLIDKCMGKIERNPELSSIVKIARQSQLPVAARTKGRRVRAK